MDARVLLIMPLLIASACTSRATVKNQKVYESESDTSSASDTGGSGGRASNSTADTHDTSDDGGSSASMGSMTATGTDAAQGGSAGSDAGQNSSGTDGTSVSTGGTTGSGGAMATGTTATGTMATGTMATDTSTGTGGSTSSSDSSTGGNPGCPDLLVDGGFEETPSAWLAWSRSGRDLIAHASDADLFIAPQSGEYLAWLGFGENETSTIEQDFTVPVEADVLTLTGYLWIATEENDIDGPFDFARIELAQGETVRVQSADWSNDDKTAGWTPLRLELDVTPYRGMRMTFRVWADSDDNLDTSFWFDTLALWACAL